MNVVEIAEARRRARWAQRFGFILHPRRQSNLVTASPSPRPRPSPMPRYFPSSSSVELSERTDVHLAIATAHEASRVLPVLLRAGLIVPPGLRPVPQRLHNTDHLCAAGFIDTSSESIVVDIALWATPGATDPDAATWQTMLDWIVVSDPGIGNPRVSGSVHHTPPSVSGDYAYIDVHDGTLGYGILTILGVEPGVWQIVDCWGTPGDIDRLRDLSRACRIIPTAR